jgi:alkaline phosphatase D
VASGDPTGDRLVIWTRVTTTAAEPPPVSWTVATDPVLSDIVASGTTTPDPDADGTVHVDVEGLRPGTTYHYGFDILGERSPVARTRTLPPPDADHLRIAMVSCAKYAAGFFNAYGRIAERDDLDFVLHLGDYIYEVSNKPPATQTVGPDIGRPYVPANECVSLDDYRARYGHYHQDPDLMAMHHAHPVIGIVDDHEFADNVWREGSLEHRDERDGPWADRRAAAFRARWEWLPARRPDPADPERVWRSVALGDLADLLLIDTRTRRDEPIDGPEQADPSRSQLGPDQRAWFLEQLAASTAAWRLIGNSSVMGHIWDERLPAETIPGLMKLEMTNEAGTGPDPDQWDGYPAERDAILEAFGDAGDVVVLSGDVHIGLAMDLPRDRHDDRAVAVELVTTSLTSQNVDDKMGWEPRTGSVPMERAWVAAIPYVKFADFDDHGYVIVDVTPERVRGEWWFIDAVREPTTGEHLGAAWEVHRGDARLVPGA